MLPYSLYLRHSAKLRYLRRIMAATLTKILDGPPADGLTNSQTVACPGCGQSYRLAYSDGEWHRVKDWLKIAEAALRRDHKARHEAVAILLEWPRLSRKR